MKIEIAFHKEAESLYIEIFKAKPNRDIWHVYRKVSCLSIDRLYVYVVTHSDNFRMDVYPYPDRLTVRYYSSGKIIK